MTQISPAKLLNSKWTAVNPQKREKHFLVTDVEFEENGAVISCTVEAIYSKREYPIDWRDLKLKEKWIQGWK